MCAGAGSFSKCLWVIPAFPAEITSGPHNLTTGLSALCRRQPFATLPYRTPHGWLPLPALFSCFLAKLRRGVKRGEHTTPHLPPHFFGGGRRQPGTSSSSIQDDLCLFLFNYNFDSAYIRLHIHARPLA